MLLKAPHARGRRSLDNTFAVMEAKMCSSFLACTYLVLAVLRNHPLDQDNQLAGVVALGNQLVEAVALGNQRVEAVAQGNQWGTRLAVVVAPGNLQVVDVVQGNQRAVVVQGNQPAGAVRDNPAYTTYTENIGFSK